MASIAGRYALLNPSFSGETTGTRTRKSPASVISVSISMMANLSRSSPCCNMPQSSKTRARYFPGSKVLILSRANASASSTSFLLAFSKNSIPTSSINSFSRCSAFKLPAILARMSSSTYVLSRTARSIMLKTSLRIFPCSTSFTALRWSPSWMDSFAEGQVPAESMLPTSVVWEMAAVKPTCLFW